jgi:type IV pilus assembly protein PilY1
MLTSTGTGTMNRSLLVLLLLCTALSPRIGSADDTDIYLNPSIAGVGSPLVMFALDYRSNLTSTACGGTECDTLIAEGYLPAAGPYNFFMVLRAVLKKVLDPLDGVQVGFMMSHDDSCTGGTTAGPGLTKCSNGGYILHGFTQMDGGLDDPDTYQTLGEDPDKVSLFAKLDAIPDPQGSVSHTFQGKELYFELFRYLTGQDVYNGHLGYTDLNDSNMNTNLDVDYPAISWDTSIETAGGTRYQSPLAAAGSCSRVFVINLMFQVSSQEDHRDQGEWWHGRYQPQWQEQLLRHRHRVHEGCRYG